MATDWQNQDLLEPVDPILADLQQRRETCRDETARYIAMILDEFWQARPKLTQVDELSLSLDSMRDWLERHREGGPVE